MTRRSRSAASNASMADNATNVPKSDNLSKESQLQRKSRYILDTDVKTEREQDDDDATKRFKYLLQLTSIFRHFIDINVSKDQHFKKLRKKIDAETSCKQPISTKVRSGAKHSRRR